MIIVIFVMQLWPGTNTWLLQLAVMGQKVSFLIRIGSWVVDGLSCSCHFAGPGIGGTPEENGSTQIPPQGQGMKLESID